MQSENSKLQTSQLPKFPTSKLPDSSLVTHHSSLTYGFTLASYNKNYPVIIDPLLASTFIGGSVPISTNEYSNSIAIDYLGNIFVAGNAYGQGFPVTPGAYDTLYNGSSDVFVLKLDNNLSSVLSSTFLGGSSGDYSKSIVIDSLDNIFVTGYTYSSNFPVTPGAYDTSYNGYYDIFVSKLNNDLTTLLSSTFLGGTVNDRGYAIDLDSGGDIFVTGFTGSSNFPTTPGAYDTSYNGYDDVFVSKLNNSLSSLLSSTLLGGGDNEMAYTLSLNPSGEVYLSGWTYSSGYYPYPTTPGAYDVSHNGITDLFVSKLNNNLTSLLASTFIGGNNEDYGSSIAIDTSGNIFVTGNTSSSNFPVTVEAYDTSYNGSYDAFVSKLNNNLSSLLSSTFLGGSNDDSPKSIALDSSGNVYLSGRTYSSGYYSFPVTPGAYDTSYNGGADAFLLKLNSNLSSLLSSTLLGGSSDDGYSNTSIAIDNGGNIFLTGDTYSPNFPVTPGVYDTSYNGGYDVFVSKLNSNLSSLVSSTFIGGTGTQSTNEYPRSVAIDGAGNVFVAGVAYGTGYPIIPGSYDTSYNGNYDVFVSKLDNNLSLLLSSTFLGGSSNDGYYNTSIAIDNGNNVFVTGDTYSYNFPVTTGVYDTSFNGGYDVFVSKLNNNLNSLLSSTFLGGSSYDLPQSIALDSSGDVYLSGRTYAYGFPVTPGAYDTSYNGYYDVFVSKLDNNLTLLLSSTLLGGNDDDGDYNTSIAIDNAGNVFVAGDTWSSNFTVTQGAYDTSYNGSYDAFVSKLNNNLSSLLSSTFLGGNNDDYPKTIALDSSGDVYLSGITYSSGYYSFPVTAGAYDTSFNGVNDVFVSKFDNNLSSLLSSTFLGGSSYDGYHNASIAIDNGSNVFVTGYTYSSDFPVTTGAYDTSHSGSSDVFVSKLNSNLSSLLSSTFLGGSNTDGYDNTSIAIDNGGNVFVTGETYSSNFPVTAGAYDTSYNGGSDVFVSKLDKNLSAGPAIRGMVFNDKNCNGQRNGVDNGIAGVKLTLTPGDIVVYTSANGTYSFTNLFPGIYVIKETDPAGYISCTPNQKTIKILKKDIANQNFGDRLQ